MNRRLIRLPFPALHLRLRKWMRASVRDKAWRWQRFERLLRDPAIDLNQVDQRGNHLLETMIEAFNKRSGGFRSQVGPEVLRAIGVLIDAGVNPLLHRIWRLENIPLDIREAMLFALIRRENEGRGLRDPHGGNALHEMVAEAKWKKEGLRHAPCHPSWIEYHRADGLTPAQALWLCSQSFPTAWHHNPEAPWPLIGSVVWPVMRDLLEMNADISVPDASGRPLFDAIAEFVECGCEPDPLGSRVGDDVEGEWAALYFLRGKALAGVTPVAVSRGVAIRL